MITYTEKITTALHSLTAVSPLSSFFLLLVRKIICSIRLISSKYACMYRDAIYIYNKAALNKLLTLIILYEISTRCCCDGPGE